MKIPSDRLGTIVDDTSGEVWNLERIQAEIRRRASVLKGLGIGPKQVIAVYHEGTPDFFADLFAAWQLGACVACLNPGLTPSELKNVVEYISASIVLLSNDENLPESISIPSIQLSKDIGAQPSADLDQTFVRMDDDALILFTSGTTGVPKGVVHTFRSILSRISLNRAYIGDAALKNSLCTLPTHFGHGLIGNCLTPLIAGNRLILPNQGAMKLAGSLAEIIDRYAISFLSSVPSFWKMVLRFDKRPKKGSLERIHVGSAPLSANLWNSIIKWSGGATVVNMYGITETANWLAGASSAEFEPQDGLLGRMWGGFAAVRAEDGTIASSGAGDILVQSPSLMKEYFNQSEATAEVFQSGWYDTGDVGKIDDDGVLSILGRSKYQINRAGLKVHPEDIDLLLETHENVIEASAFAVPDDIAGEMVGVAVILSKDGDTSVMQLREWCFERLIKEKVPTRWFVVSEIPKTDRGKINRDTVADYCLNKENCFNSK